MTRNAVIESYEFVMMQFIKTALERGHYFDMPRNYSLYKKNQQGVRFPSQLRIP